MHDILLTIFTGVLAIAVLIQGIVFFLIHRSIRQMTVKLDSLGNDLLQHAEMVSEKVNDGLTVIKDVAQDLKPITEKLSDTIDIVHKRVKEVDGLLGDFTGSARLEILRIQDTFHDASRRIQETIEILRNSLVTPLNEINAISRAIRVAIDVIFRRRKGLSTAAMDEEMFI
jgi:hypothetical protein